MSNRRKWWKVCSRKTFIWFTAIALGYFVSRAPLLFSQDKAAEPTAPTTSDAAAPTDKPPELPAYFTPDPSKQDSPFPDATGGASGASVAAASDGKGDVPSTFTVPQLYDKVAHNWLSINFVWTLVTGFLVMFMQAGFAMVEGGLCRSKNSRRFGTRKTRV